MNASDSGTLWVYSASMSEPFDAFKTVLACLKRMEPSLMGMKQMRGYVGKGLGKEMLNSLIEEAESQITKIKQGVVQ